MVGPFGLHFLKCLRKLTFAQDQIGRQDFAKTQGSSHYGFAPKVLLALSYSGTTSVEKQAFLREA
jgi:hypothetical protein